MKICYNLAKRDEKGTLIPQSSLASANLTITDYCFNDESGTKNYHFEIEFVSRGENNIKINFNCKLGNRVTLKDINMFIERKLYDNITIHSKKLKEYFYLIVCNTIINENTNFIELFSNALTMYRLSTIAFDEATEAYC